MTSSAQKQANKRNAQFSTGPATQQGKAASSRNAIRHNLSGTIFVLLPSEDRSAFEQLARDYRRDWNPRTEHESFLVTQMVQARWKLNRIARMEAEILDTVFGMPFAEGKSDEAAIVIAHPLMNEAMLDKLHRYAKDAERSYHRAAKELRIAQANRPKPAAEPVEKPVVSKPATPSYQSETPKYETNPIVPPAANCPSFHEAFGRVPGEN